MNIFQTSSFRLLLIIWVSQVYVLDGFRLNHGTKLSTSIIPQYIPRILRKTKLTATTLNRMDHEILALCRDQQITKALNLLQEMHKVKKYPTIRSYFNIINTSKKLKQWRIVITVLDFMERAQIIPDQYCFGAAISTLSQGGQWKKALEIFHSMEKKGVTPNVISFSAAISACEKGGQWEKALEIFHSMEKSAITPTDVTITTLIEILHKENQTIEALSILRSAQSLEYYNKVWVTEGKVDLHECSAAVARTIMRQYLIDLRQGMRSVCDVVVVTGRGKGSKGDPVLPSAMRQFFSEENIKITEVPLIPGRFILKKEDLVDITHH